MKYCKALTGSGRLCGNEALPGSDYCHMKPHQPPVKQKFYWKTWNAIKRRKKIWSILLGLVALLSYIRDPLAFVADLTGLYSSITQNTKKDIRDTVPEIVRDELRPTADALKKIDKSLDIELKITYGSFILRVVVNNAP